MRPAIILGVIAAVLALVVSRVVPQLRDEPVWRSEPLVQDLATQPEITWSAKGGEPCHNQPNDDHAILFRDDQVWALDLTDGSTVWSLDLEGHGRVTCLPGPGLVAVILADEQTNAAPRTVFLEASTGLEVAELPGSSVVHVVALGSAIGLVDDADLLSAVHLGDLEKSLWTRQLPTIPFADSALYVQQIDDEVVELTSFGGPEAEDPPGFSLQLAVTDGTTPAWAQSSTGNHRHQRLGDVILRFKAPFYFADASVLDLQGRELWSTGKNLLSVAGSHLFVSWPSSSDPATGYSNLHEVDPRTGEPVDDKDYKGWFHETVAVQDHIAVDTGGTLHILDKSVQEQPAIDVEAFSMVHEGRDLVYVVSQPESVGARLSAIDPDRERVVWTLDVESDRFIYQLGSHLVVVESPDDVHMIHGLSSQS